LLQKNFYFIFLNGRLCTPIFCFGFGLPCGGLVLLWWLNWIAFLSFGKIWVLGFCGFALWFMWSVMGVWCNVNVILFSYKFVMKWYVCNSLQIWVQNIFGLAAELVIDFCSLGGYMVRFLSMFVSGLCFNGLIRRLASWSV
jgi:hypothetical protein